MRELWHFTCEHGHDGIGNRGRLIGNRHPLMPELGRVVWLTTDPAPERDAVGLTSSFITCDRMAYRYRVTDTDAAPWRAYRPLVHPAVLHDLESYAEPDAWWVGSWADVVLA